MSKSTAKKYILPEQTASHQKAETKILWQKLSQRVELVDCARVLRWLRRWWRHQKLFYSLDFVLQNSCQHLIWLRTLAQTTDNSKNGAGGPSWWWLLQDVVTHFPRLEIMRFLVDFMPCSCHLFCTWRKRRVACPTKNFSIIRQE